MNKICLIGFMGSGKTTVGQALAEKLSCSWVDTDNWIEEKAGKTIASLFKEEGEKGFRKRETAALKEVLKWPQVVVSTGGGIITTPVNIEILKHEKVFWLDYDFETLFGRIQGDETRPLVTNKEEVYQRFQMRKPLYEAAARYRIDCHGQSIEELVKEILEKA